MKKYLLILLFLSLNIQPHENNSIATYLGNEAVMITNGEIKVLFDPFFHNNFNIYQLVPNEIISKLFENKPPYNDINAIFVSHAHADHFDAAQMLKYLKSHPKTKLIAPKQATKKLFDLKSSNEVKKQVTSIELKYGDKPKTIKFEDLIVEALRIPHSGWPTRRTDISNLAFRVTLNETVTVMHLGDADPNDIHFKPYKEYWNSKTTNTTFPPYWFFYSTYGPEILTNRINTLESIGIHVPVTVPLQLKLTGAHYFSKPGETSNIAHQH